MDFRFNTVLKEHYAFLVADAEGQVTSGEHGLYDRDTRFLSRYAWGWSQDGRDLQTLTSETPRLDRYYAHHASIAGPSQRLAVRRALSFGASGFVDELIFENTSGEEQLLDLKLGVGADFKDLFEVRGWQGLVRLEPDAEVSPAAVTFGLTSSDGLRQGVTVSLEGPDASVSCAETGEGAGAACEFAWKLTLAAGAVERLRVRVTIDNPLAGPPGRAEDYSTWRERFSSLRPPGELRRVVERAVDDLRGLLLYPAEGQLPAAGIPWFVAAFGRDALLTANLLLPYAPQVAAGTLRYLGRHQGSKDDPRRGEQPGKIMHELRFGELTRTGRAPHSPYFGTVDATPLYLMLLEQHRLTTGSLELVRELAPVWEAGLEWMLGPADVDGDGFLEYVPDRDGGLAVQAWKDSHDSMCHADGSLAEGAVAVAEVQGYAYAAMRAAAIWCSLLGDVPRAAELEARAEALAHRFHEVFWLERLGTYAMALDGDKRPLEVLSSNAGQLLWTGIVPPGATERLVRTLEGDELWSGWGIRTLGSAEVRYNPVSYHNGSVWPHDSALIAAGMARYGYKAAARRVARALLDLAAAQTDLRLPELVAGYPRDERPPVPYPVACRPQAWDAAAVIHLLRYL